MSWQLRQKAVREQGPDANVDMDADLRRALEQVSIISEALCDIQLRHQVRV